MSKVILLVCVVVIAVSLLACSKPESSTNRNAAAPTTAPAASPVASAPTTAASAGEKIGVPECDQFITAYENCVTGKVPAAARAQYNTAIAQWRSSWKKLAETPQAKATLPGVCKTQLDAARTSMKSFGCTF